jgi:hypothetical protein
MMGFLCQNLYGKFNARFYLSTGGTYSTCGGNVKYSLNVVPEPERKISLEDVDIDGRIM